MIVDASLSAVVTGGASGLGEAVVRALVERGAKVTAFDLDAGRGDKLALETGCDFLAVDVSDQASVATGLSAARIANGQERLMVNCAGIALAELTVGKTGWHDPAIFAKTLAVNLTGTFNCATQSAAGMATLGPVGRHGERGVLVNTASIAAYEGQIGQIAYSASKAGVAGMTLPMARDLSRHAIRAVCIAPGLFATPMVSGFSEEVQEALKAPLVYPAEAGDPADFAALVIHICENPMLNGEVIRLDGAYRMPPV